MATKKPLEQPILNAIIRYAYALHEDEEAALLSAFLVISYHTHREAVASMLPGERYDQLMSGRIPVTAAEESFIEAASELTYREPLIIGHLRYVIATTSNLPEYIRSNIIAPVHAAITKPAGALIDSLRQSMRFISRRQRESILQEEEELALFSTIEGVADQVNREAFETEIMQGIGRKVRFATAYERTDMGPWGSLGIPIENVIVGRESKNNEAKLNGKSMDTYIEFMDEELKITRGIIDRNRALSQLYMKAHPV